MQAVQTILETRSLIHAARLERKTIGCVPTMGALHEGHLSLIRKAVSETDYVVVTIFVNPTQFGPGEDFKKYPRVLQQDLSYCEQAEAALVFHPTVEEMYADNRQVSMIVGDLASRWEGASRPGHFDGVAMVVAKLFNITQPDRAYFGAKDFQQLSIIKTMVREYNHPIEVVTCPTVREESGLAMSSRNAYLSTEERETATIISRSLRQAKSRFGESDWTVPQIREELQQTLQNEQGLKLDYATIVDDVTLQEVNERQSGLVGIVAAYVGKTRLIDNLEMDVQ